jgi:phosphoenolpyruvate-protein phosphotransferase
MTDILTIKSPLSGWVMALADTPDPVFAQGMAGDGVAINPVGSTLCAPCDGIIVANANTPHALGLRVAGGIQLLMHIGIDTVRLHGSTFTVLVRDGETVCAGQTLIEFDLERIVSDAGSPVTPVLLSGDGARIGVRRINCAVQAGDDLFEVHFSGTANVPSASAGENCRQRVTVVFGQGLHARPAAQLAAALRPFAATTTIHFNNRSADARSMLAVMALGIKQHDVIELETSGSDSETALQALLAFFEADAGPLPVSAVVSTPQLPANGVIKAVIASRGLAVGRAFHLRQEQLVVPEQGRGVAVERAALHEAVADVLNYLESRLDSRDIQQHSILQAHVEMIRDPGLLANAEHLLDAGKSAAFAWRCSARDASSALAAAGDPYMNERAADLRDLEQQVLQVLAGSRPGTKRAIPESSIVLAEELLPSHMLDLDTGRIAGICTSGGGPAAHAAIIAASLGIPFLVAAGKEIEAIAEASDLVLDAEKGALHTQVSPDEMKAFSASLAERRQRASFDLEQACAPAQTKDGTTVAVYANLGGLSEVEAALRQGAEGCGLFRTEFLFQDRQSAPDEDEQFGIYRDIAEHLDGRLLNIRTMDIGGDKPIPYLPLPKEDNPALGLRGVRTSFWQDGLFRTQLRAILRLRRSNQVRILLPMINDLADVALARDYITRCARELGIEDIPPIGIMIETPASALMADQLLPAVDFASIGSNDLSQYILAIDRGHPELAGKLDALHPAVLRCIRQLAESATATGRKLSLCGGLASDPLAVPLLLGVGVFELSAVPAMVPRVKALVRGFSLTSCQALAEKAVYLPNAAAVRAIASEFIAESGDQP